MARKADAEDPRRTRLREAMALAGCNNTTLANVVGVNRTAVGHWTRPHKPGQRQVFAKPDHIEPICSYLGIRPEWLLFGRGLSGQEITSDGLVMRGRRIPRITAADIISGARVGAEHCSSFPCSATAFAYIVGPSIGGDLLPADSVVVVDPSAQVRPGRLALVATTAHIIIGRLKAIDPTGKKYQLIPLSRDWPELPADTKSIIGCVTEYAVPCD